MTKVFKSEKKGRFTPLFYFRQPGSFSWRWYTWEILQHLLGGLAIIFLNNRIKASGCLDSVQWFRIHGRWGGLSLGTRLFMDSGGLAMSGNGLFMHEFGHSLQSRKLGPLYLFVIGLPSLFSAWVNPHHATFWTEIWANRLAYNYFSKNGPVKWDETNYPLR